MIAHRIHAPSEPALHCVALDSAVNMYIADTIASLVRKVSPDGIIARLAGGRSSVADGVPATQAGLYFLYSLAVMGTDLYIAETAPTVFLHKRLDVTGFDKCVKEEYRRTRSEFSYSPCQLICC